ncbi:hypothetical protein CGRA01v4_12378 [Colletotrichum graminicola]|uniref:Uncharacterized protein n=1 Tax=Colletotrichum graminicola (strain M1.001 / M2 / FGSC 10212) TaxID=645133 RepID=E3QS74_COLGM|nr:uncharacterized protein GLRG_08957 [Colletotrichum graminicola M1.001]EFQ33813.1 hypothetical protein GLRG_08957 [Colletotrichum graminicola M1.001]WDK21089.1 hypothetical protein CGRA01v4_12378 [Colletotrichum graminicola]
MADSHGQDSGIDAEDALEAVRQRVSDTTRLGRGWMDGASLDAGKVAFAAIVE